MNFNPTKASIYLREELVGFIEKTPQGTFIFTYEDSWLKSGKGGISFSLPPNQKTYESNELFPFFDNLIPEGWLFSQAQQVHKIDKKNRFGLLLATGQSTIGAIKVIALDSNNNKIMALKGPAISLEKCEIQYPSLHCSSCLQPLKQGQKKPAQLLPQKVVEHNQDH